MSERRPEGTLTERVPGADQSGGGRRPIGGEPDVTELGDWLNVEPDGSITVFVGKAEVGQNIRTSLAQVVAEELRVPLEAVRLVMADTDLTPFDLGTFGSRTTPTLVPRLRDAAAEVRELLLDMAAARLEVARQDLHTSGGAVVHGPSGRLIGFGDLTGGRRLDGAQGREARVTPPDQWQVAGSPAPKANGSALVTGEHRYASDLQRPGMLVGKVLRAPAAGATLLALDTAAAEAMPEVSVVREGDLVGVVAPDQLAATRALEALHVTWSEPEGPSNRELYDHIRAHPAEPADGVPEPPVVEQGSLGAGRAAATLTLQATYTVAYIAHAPLEPRAAVAEWDGDRLTVWTGTQRPFGVRSELALALGLPEERVRVIVPDTGSAYGGKHTGEVALEAARLSRAAGRPVKVVWTRQEEFAHAYFRPAGVLDVSGSVGPDGTLTSWEFHNYNSGPAGIRTPYAVPNQLIEFHPTETPLRQGSYRALAATANHFARETHMDELALALGLDPLDFRLRNLTDERLRAVLEAAAERFGWGERVASPGHGFGLACGTEKGSYVATCAEVAVDGEDGHCRVLRVVQAFECGAIYNPENVRLQNEGCIAQGLGGALFEEIRFERGTVLSDRLSRYRVPRFRDMPSIEVVLLDRKDLPSAGAGETPIVGIAPAVGNALANASGVWVRSLPLASGGVLV
ncbi:MAG: molybdopterin-dependent oxidoreductase [Chloroflexota bacterium]|nr:molybdopterin-dependent oxidoreductase [Chloroflexota bacterium]